MLLMLHPLFISDLTGLREGRLMLYQLSYFRKKPPSYSPKGGKTPSLWEGWDGLWAVKDSNLRSRKTAELQSAPVGHFGNCPKSGAKIQFYFVSTKQY